MFVRLGLIVLLVTAMQVLVFAGDSQEPEIELQLSPKPIHPRMFDTVFGAGFGYGFPVGDFYSNLDSGSLLLGDIRIAVSAKSYIKFGYRNMNIFNETQVDGAISGVSEIALDVRQYLFSIGWLLSPSKNHHRRMYFELGAGVGDHVVTYTYEWGPISHGDSKVMLVGQFGMFVPINNSAVGMDVGVSVLAKVTSGDYEEGKGAILAAHLGLVLLLGGG